MRFPENAFPEEKEPRRKAAEPDESSITPPCQEVSRQAGQWTGVDLDRLCRLELRQLDGACSGHSDGSGGRAGEVDDTAMGVRTPVVDPHDHRLSGALVYDAHAGAEGQGAVSRRECVRVEGLAACRPSPVKTGAVPGGPTALNRSSGSVVRLCLDERGCQYTGAQGE
jgi:hypothetical protein